MKTLALLWLMCFAPVANEPPVQRLDATHARLSGAAYWRIETDGTPPWVNQRFLDSLVYTRDIRANGPGAPWLPTPDTAILRFWLAGEMVLTLEPGRSYSVAWYATDSIQERATGWVRMVGGVTLAGDMNLDGRITIEDQTLFLDLYIAGDLRSDLDDGSGIGTPDGGVGIEDLLYFQRVYEAGI